MGAVTGPRGRGIGILLTASCCAAETNTVVNQLYANKKLIKSAKKKNWETNFLFKNSFPGRFLWMHLTCQASDTRVVFNGHLHPDIAGPDLILTPFAGPQE